MPRLRLFIALLLVPLWVAAADKVTLVNDPWPPYVLGNGANGQAATDGLAIELINLVFDRLEQTEVEVLLIPWRKSLHGVERGHYDGIPLLFKTPERQAYMTFSEPLFQARTVFFYKSDRYPEGISWNSFEELARYRIAVQHSFSIAETFQAQIDQGVPLQVEMMNADEECFRLLIHDRVDLVATNEVVGNEYIRQLGQSGVISASSQSLYEKPFFIGFSKKTDAQQLIPQINRIIGELREQGEIDRVLKGGSD